MEVDRPSGTVTFLFTDIEDSSRHWEDEPASMSRALARHDELLQGAVSASRGVVFASAGDGLVAVFARAGDAVDAAVAGQRALAAEPWPLALRVRMGLHTGEAEERDGSYFGPAVNRAARLMALATGGQVLVSLATQEVVRDRLPEGVGLIELGARELRSLRRPEQVFELTWATDGAPTALEVGVLGPLQLAVGTAAVDVPGPKRRAVLALLAMASPRPLSVTTLVTALWPAETDASGRAALQSHVSRLRRHLGAASSRLESAPAGYRLLLGVEELDATSAADLLDTARRLMPSDPAGALTLVRDARRHWRGPALEEFLDVEPLVAWRRSLEELRLAAADLHAELAVVTGDHREAIEVAAATVAEEPLRESSVLLLMRALAGAGRAADALRAAHAHRQALADRTGLQPSAALAALEHTVAADPDEPASPPPARAPSRPRLIGRDAELTGIGRLVRTESLVTLVGPGGVGKTRLAMEMARQERAGREVAIVNLASVTEPTALADVLAGALGLRGSVGDPLLACQAMIGTKPWLIVIDNCEHLLSAVRDLVATLTDPDQELTILATSRERLGLPDEQVCRVAPLPLPAPEQRGDLEQVPSVAIFLERARRVRADFRPNEDELAAIAAMVRRLDGMPLAIELAAGRLSSLGLADLATRLDRALDVLTATTDGGDRRHGTLRAAIAWSYELLTEDQQRVFRHLAVFPDGFDLAAAEEVAAEVAPGSDPTTTVAHLADASMLVASFGATTRYRMLDTLRTFGLDQLAAHDELGAATSRFLRWAAQCVAWIDERIMGHDEPLADRRFHTELGNLRAAWHLARTTGNLDVMVALVVSLHMTVVNRDQPEICRWATELARDPRLPGYPGCASVFAAAADALWLTEGDLGGARDLAERGLALAGDDRPARERCVSALIDIDFFQGEVASARERSVELSTSDRWAPLGVMVGALAAAYLGDLDDARALNDRALDFDPGPGVLSLHHYVAGEIGNLAGAWDAAERHYRRAIELAELSGETFMWGIAWVGLVTVHAAGGQVREALLGYRELLEYWERSGAWTQQWTTLRNLADLLARLGDDDTASSLRAAADAAPEAAPVTNATPAAVVAPAAVIRDREQVLTLARAAITHRLDALVRA